MLRSGSAGVAKIASRIAGVMLKNFTSLRKEASNVALARAWALWETEITH